MSNSRYFFQHFYAVPLHCIDKLYLHSHIILKTSCFTIQGDVQFSWRIKETDVNPQDSEKKPRKAPKLTPFRPRSLRTSGPCQWLLCSSGKIPNRLKDYRKHCSRIPANVSFQHHSQWKWINHHKLLLVRPLFRRSKKNSQVNNNADGGG